MGSINISSLRPQDHKVQPSYLLEWDPKQHKQSYNINNQLRLQEIFSGCSWVSLPCYNFFFFRFSVTIFSFLDFSSKKKFSFFFLLESNVMNTVLNPVSVCLVEWNISIPIYFDAPFQGVSGFPKEIKNNIYLYFLIQHKIIDPNN